MSIVRFLFQTLGKTLNFKGVNFLVSCIFLLLIGQGLLAQTQLGSDINANVNANGNGVFFGSSVASSYDGSIVAIGDWRASTQNRGSEFGRVLIFQYSGGSWSQLGSDIVGLAAGDQSGHSVSLSSDGTIVAVGSPGHDTGAQNWYSNAGVVRIYQYSGGSWSQLGADIEGPSPNSASGTSVSLSNDGSRVAIGGNTFDGKGYVEIYEFSAGSWSRLGTRIIGEADKDYSGYSVSLSSDGSRVAIGAYKNDADGVQTRWGENVYNSGHVRIYELQSNNSWTQLGADIDGEAQGDMSGWSVSLSSDGSKVAIGAIANDGNGNSSGHTRIYQYSSGSWSQLGGDIDGAAEDDNSGYSVSLSSDGTRVAIGAKEQQGEDGYVRVYDYDGSAWVQAGADIDGGTAGDQSGYSVSLSSDGSTVVIGAPYNGDNGVSNSGLVKVYQLSPSSSTATLTITSNDSDNVITSGQVTLNATFSEDMAASPTISISGVVTNVAMTLI